MKILKSGFQAYSLALLIFLSFFITGCGGGGGGGGLSSSGTSVSSGVFVDSAVEGLTYSTATQSGKTNSSGTFQYISGETVSFYIGNVLIGSATAQSTLTPVNLVSGGDINNSTVINIARVLQTFDSDKNASNGITLVNAAQNLDLNITIDFSEDSNISFLISDVNSTDGNLSEVNTTDAQQHLNETLNTPPSFTSSSTVSVNENQTSALTLAATDVDGNTVTFTISGGDYNSFDINSSTGVVTFKSAPDYETKSSYTFTATATDGIESTTQSITINIADVTNTSPVLSTIDDQITTMNTDLNVTLSATDTDSDKIVYEANSSVGSVTPSVNNSILTLTLQSDWTGEANITVTATDDNVEGNLTSIKSFTLTVVDPDSAPTVANAISDVSVAQNASDTTIDLTSVFTDVDDNDSTITKAVQSNSDTSLVSATILNDTLTLDYQANQTGTATIIIRATSNGKTVDDTFLVSVSDVDNDPTVASAISDVSVQKNSSDTIIDLTSVFTDVDDNDSAITKAVQSNSNTSLVSATISDNTLTLDYQTDQTGTATIVIRATSNGKTVDDTFTISVFESTNDTDNDYIPDNIEDYIGMDKNSDDYSLSNNTLDNFFQYQWHIKSYSGRTVNNSGVTTVEDNDLDIEEVYRNYMGYNNGDPITVQICDTGVDADHEDLIDNMDLSLSRNSSTRAMGDPVETGTHGTMCAGIIGARAFNNKGVRGVAPFVKIAGSNWLGYQSASELEEVWTKNDSDGKIALVSNSWGTESASPYTFYESLMDYASSNLRKVGGVAKGKLFLKAAGNGRGNYHDSGLSYVSSNKYVITVAALKNTNVYADYSSSGSNILVSGYSGNYYNDSPTIGTTTVMGQGGSTTWSDDTSKNYTFAMNGTSAATPMVAGSVALLLEACPDLTWRDVRYLIAKNATKIDASNSTWITNSAGLSHSVDYGFGLVNTNAMISECQSTGYTQLGTSSTTTESFTSISKSIPDNDSTGVEHQFTVTANKTIEWIGMTIFSDHTYGADLEIYLTSPSGTRTRIMMGQNSGSNYSLSSGFRYGTVAFIGENSAGTWTVKIADIWEADTGTLNQINFEVFGH